MPSLTAVKYTNKKIKKYLKIGGIALGAIAVITAAVLFVMKSGILNKKVDTDGKDFRMTSAMNSVVSETEFHKGYMFSRTTKLLSEDRMMEPFVLSWYLIPGTTRSVPEMESSYVDTLDQVLLLESYILEGKRSKADAMIKAIDNSLTDESGFLFSFKRADDLISPDSRTKTQLSDLYEDPLYIRYSEPPVSLAATTRYIRALLNYYDKWGGSSLFSRIKELSGKIFSSGEQTTYRPADQLAIPTPEPVTEKSLITPIPEQPEEDPEKMVALSGIELGGLDLEALRRATVLWSEYKEKYESLVEMVKGGKISQDLPLYAWMYSEESGYMYYTGSSGEVDLVSSLRVMVYLAEIGQLDKEGYAWVSQQIYNAGVLYESYDVISGYAISEKEAYEAYPLVLYLALIKGDEDLFSVTYNVMMRNYATLSTSTALYAFFRDVEDSRIAVYARENLLMELILR